MTEPAKKPVKENQIQAKSRIDSRADLIDPIDFSFKDLMNLEEINDATPRLVNNRPAKLVDGKFASLSLKLGYNALKEIPGFYQWCEFSFAYPEKISSLDLSFNCFSVIPEEILNLQGLKCLYLHGNKINNLLEVEKLKK
ncbi:leucine-rich repeat-containing 51-like, partial [Brachionus plicatilis]